MEGGSKKNKVKKSQFYSIAYPQRTSLGPRGTKTVGTSHGEKDK